MKLKTALELLGDDHLGPFGWSDEEQRVGLTVSQLERFARRAREEAHEMALTTAAPIHDPVCRYGCGDCRSGQRIQDAIRALPTDPKP